jgi:hypothetical protein
MSSNDSRSSWRDPFTAPGSRQRGPRRSRSPKGRGPHPLSPRPSPTPQARPGSSDASYERAPAALAEGRAMSSPAQDGQEHDLSLGLLFV